MPKFYARITRDIVHEIQLGALVVTGLQSNNEGEIAPPRVHRTPMSAGTVTTHKTKRDRDMFMASVNAQHAGSVEAV